MVGPEPRPVRRKAAGRPGAGRRPGGRWLTAGCLVLALLLYAAGLAQPAGLFILLGLVAEAVFWVRLFGRR